MKNIIVVSSLNRDLLPVGENWLVIGPFCWGKSRSLPMALNNASANISSGGGSFTARVIPDGQLNIEHDGSYGVTGWTPEQKQRATDTTRVVAVTKSASKLWGNQAKLDLKTHNQRQK